MMSKAPKYVNTLLQHVGLKVIRSKKTEAAQTALCLRQLSVTTLFDVGANVGKFACSMKDEGFKGKIVCFEPLPDAYKLLKDAVSNYENVIVHDRAALGSEEGEEDINISGNSVSSSLLGMLPSHSNASPKSSYIGSVKTRVSRLDSVFEDYATASDVVFLKIDTQGYESHVLDGAGEKLDSVDGILLELSLVPLYDGQTLWKELVDRLTASGFVLWRVLPGFTDHSTSQMLQFDGLFVRKEALERMQEANI